MADQRVWCRILYVEDIAVLFYQDVENGVHRIHAIFKGDGVQSNMMMVADKAFTLIEFNAYANVPVARALIEYVRGLGVKVGAGAESPSWTH